MLLLGGAPNDELTVAAPDGGREAGTQLLEAVSATTPDRAARRAEPPSASCALDHSCASGDVGSSSQRYGSGTAPVQVIHDVAARGSGVGRPAHERDYRRPDAGLAIVTRSLEIAPNVIEEQGCAG